MNLKLTTLIITGLLASISGSVIATNWNVSLEERVTELENQAKNSNVKIDTFNRIERLQQELQELRGELEQLRHSQILKLQPEQKPVSAPTPVVPAPVLPMLETNSTNEQASYQHAFQLVTVQKYNQAIAAWQDFQQRFPQGKYAAASHYWLGEVYLTKWENEPANKLLLNQAKSEFLTITTTFPEYKKSNDAKLKLGIIASEQGYWSAAREYLTNIVSSTPNSATAQIAKVHLKLLQQQGH